MEWMLSKPSVIELAKTMPIGADMGQGGGDTSGEYNETAADLIDDLFGDKIEGATSSMESSPERTFMPLPTKKYITPTVLGFEGKSPQLLLENRSEVNHNCRRAH
jgi:hypothetical protein